MMNALNSYVRNETKVWQCAGAHVCVCVCVCARTRDTSTHGSLSLVHFAVQLSLYSAKLTLSQRKRSDLSIQGHFSGGFGPGQ